MEDRQHLRPIRSFLLLGAACLTLCACAAIPDLGEAPKAKPSSEYAASRSFAAPVADWPQDRWWTAYKDPQLDQLITEALAGSPGLAQAEARVRQADAMAQQVGASLGPQLGAGASVSEAKLSYNDEIPRAIIPHGWRDSGAVGVDLSWQIDFFGKNRALLAAATSEAEARRAELAAARMALSTAVAGAYADLASLYADHDAAEDAVRTRRESEALIKSRYAQGLETRAALDRAHAERAQAEADLAALNESIGISKNAIAALLAKGPDRGLSVGRPSQAALRPFGLPADLPAELLGRRPDVIAARLTAEAAAKTIEAAKADFYPNVNLVALAGFQSIGLNMLTKSGSTLGAVGPAVTLPIFTAGRLQGQYRSARADYDLAIATYDETVTRALQQVADAAVSARALGGRLEKSREALDAAKSAYELTRQRYEHGLGTYLDVLSAEDSLISTRRDVAELEARAFVIDVSLVRALGGGYRA